MDKSELSAILKRLEAMRTTEATEVQSRRFEFDNIDLVAIELYDLLTDN